MSYLSKECSHPKNETIVYVMQIRNEFGMWWKKLCRMTNTCHLCMLGDCVLQKHENHQDIVFFYRRHIASMTQRKLDREEYRRRKQNGKIVYPKNLQDERFHNWLMSEVLRAKAVGEEIDADVLVLVFHPLAKQHLTDPCILLETISVCIV